MTVLPHPMAATTREPGPRAPSAAPSRPSRSSRSPRDPAPSLVSLVRLLVLFTVALGGAAIGSTVYALYLHDLARVAATTPPPPAVRAPVPPRAPRATLAWMDALPDAPACSTGHDAPRSIGPVEATVDGSSLLVGLLWLSGAEQDGLHVAAFDALTLKPRWIAGPFPGVGGAWAPPRHTLDIADDAVVLGDTEGMMRVLDLRTGEEVRATAMKRRLFHACTDGAAVRLLFDGAMPPGSTAASGGAVLFEPSTGKLIPTMPAALPPVERLALPRIDGKVLATRRAPSGTFVVASRATGVHLVALDPGNAAIRFDVTLAGSGPATEIRGLGSAGTDVFVRTATAMLVADGRSGVIRGRLEAL